MKIEKVDDPKFNVLHMLNRTHYLININQFIFEHSKQRKTNPDHKTNHNRQDYILLFFYEKCPY